MVEFGKKYKYRDICAAHGWKETSGQAKQRQIKCIEESYEFYHPINPKTQKEEKSYIFTKQIKEPILTDGRANNGGFRENAGKKALFPEEEFEYLWSVFISGGYRRNIYHEYRDYFSYIYFTSSLLFKEFGFDYYAKMEKIVYSETDNLAKQVFQNIVYDCLKSQTITRLCKKYKLNRNSLPKGILRSRSLQRKNLKISDNELLPLYNQWEQEEIEAKGYKSKAEAINNGDYAKILNAVSHRFEKEKRMYNVRKVNYIAVDFNGLKSLGTSFGDMELISKYQENFKKVILSSVEGSVKRRIKNNEKYTVKLDSTQKELLDLYLQQLLGNAHEGIKHLTFLHSFNKAFG